MIVAHGIGGCITFEAIRWLSANGKVPIVWLNWTGRPMSVTLPLENEVYGQLKLNQFRAHLDPQERFRIATEFIRSKVKSSYALLDTLELDYEPYHHEAPKDLNSLLIHEAQSASVYYEALKPVFEKVAPKFNYRGRVRNSTNRLMNAKTEIGAMLNYAFGVLAGICQAAIASVGLESSVGFVHNTKVATTPLTYDYQELARWIADLAVIRCLEIDQLNVHDFHRLDNYSVYLTMDTAKKLVRCMDDFFSTKVVYKHGNSLDARGVQRWAYHSILRDKTQNLANYLNRLEKTGGHKRDAVLDLSVPVYRPLILKQNLP
ncbi:MAG: CRISPR-associated endonuclease Cas1 [Rhabdochlamydiaceae bacterium]